MFKYSIMELHLRNYSIRSIIIYQLRVLKVPGDDGKLAINWAGKPRIDDETKEYYAQQVIRKQLFERPLQILDSYRCHISKGATAVMEVLNIDIAIILGSCTKNIQSAVVSWKNQFKEKIQDMHDDWLSTGDLPVTRQ